MESFSDFRGSIVVDDTASLVKKPVSDETKAEVTKQAFWWTSSSKADCNVETLLEEDLNKKWQFRLKKVFRRETNLLDG